MGGLIMVGKWYKFIGKKDKYFTPNKWYLCQEVVSNGTLWFIDNENDINFLNWFPLEDLNKHFDLSNPMDYNPDEVKEEVKEVQPKFTVETITIIIFNDVKYQTNTTLSPKELIKHLKEATYRLDKQINEG
jgi:hypothetical protein